MPRNTINNTLRPQNAQHRPAPTSNLSPPSILNNARAKSKAHRLCLKQQKLILRLNLQRDLGLPIALPTAQNRGVG